MLKEDGCILDVDVKNFTGDFKVGDIVEYDSNFDNKRNVNAPYTGQIVDIFPYYINVEVFGEIGNFIVSVDKKDIMLANCLNKVS